MTIEPEKDGNHWNSAPPEDRMEWICSMCPVVRNINKWKGLNHRGVYDEVNRVYSDSANLGKVIFEVVAQAMKMNKVD